MSWDNEISVRNRCSILLYYPITVLMENMKEDGIFTIKSCSYYVTCTLCNTRLRNTYYRKRRHLKVCNMMNQIQPQNKSNDEICEGEITETQKESLA